MVISQPVVCMTYYIQVIVKFLKVGILALHQDTFLVINDEFIGVCNKKNRPPNSPLQFSCKHFMPLGELNAVSQIRYIHLLYKYIWNLFSKPDALQSRKRNHTPSGVVTMVTVWWASCESNGHHNRNKQTNKKHMFWIYKLILECETSCHIKIITCHLYLIKLLELSNHLMAIFPVNTMFWRSLSAQHIYCVIIFSLVFTKSQTNNCHSEESWYIAGTAPLLPIKEKMNLFQFFPLAVYYDCGQILNFKYIKIF